MHLMDRGSWSVLNSSSTTIDVFVMMTVQLICLCDVYKIDVFTNSINLFDTIGRQRAKWKANHCDYTGSGFQVWQFELTIPLLSNPWKQLYNVFAHKWISPWRGFPSNRECVFLTRLTDCHWLFSQGKSKQKGKVQKCKSNKQNTHKHDRIQSISATQLKLNRHVEVLTNLL